MAQIKAEGLSINIQPEKVDFNIINDSNSLVKKFEQYQPL